MPVMFKIQMYSLEFEKSDKAAEHDGSEIDRELHFQRFPHAQPAIARLT